VRTAAGAAIPSDATVAVPVIRPSAFSGVPVDDEGFIVVDDFCRVGNERSVFAAGDCTNLPLKQGGIASQQADTAAAGIAAMVGAEVEPTPLRPQLRALLFTGENRFPSASPAVTPSLMRRSKRATSRRTSGPRSTLPTLAR
jgi:sulfide:quinone oxidoreductase